MAQKRVSTYSVSASMFQRPCHAVWERDSNKHTGKKKEKKRKEKERIDKMISKRAKAKSLCLCWGNVFTNMKPPRHKTSEMVQICVSVQILGIEKKKITEETLCEAEAACFFVNVASDGAFQSLDSCKNTDR